MTFDPHLAKVLADRLRHVEPQAAEQLLAAYKERVEADLEKTFKESQDG